MQLYRDYNKPLKGSLLTNQYINGKPDVFFFFVAQVLTLASFRTPKIEDWIFVFFVNMETRGKFGNMGKLED